MKTSLKAHWKKLRKGDSLSDAELRAMIKQAEVALNYLADRLPEFHLAWKETLMDLNRMRGWQSARKRRNN